MLNRKRNERANTSQETSLIARGTVIRGDLRFSGVSRAPSWPRAKTRCSR